MCFSATASFAASAALAGGGLIILDKAKRPNEKALAIVPLIFAAQQVIEGMLWLNIADPILNPILSMAYLAIAWAFWPVWWPAAVSLIEPSYNRRTVLRLLTLMGLVLTVWALQRLFTIQVSAHVWQRCLAYPDLVPSVVFYGMFVLAVFGGCFASSHQMIRLFGVALLFSYFAAYTMNRVAGDSVWCFFAAILSGILYLHFTSDTKGRRKGPSHVK